MADLIGQNADYLVHKISEQLHMRRMPRPLLHYSQAIQVLQSVVSHGNEEVCLLIKDVLDELLLSLDLGQLEAELVWEGLDVVANNCARWVDQRNSDGSGGEDGGEGVVEVTGGGMADKERDIEDMGDTHNNCEEHKKGVELEAIGRYFMNYHKEKARKEEEEESEGVTDGCGDKEGPEEEPYSAEQKLPCCESVCVEVLRRSVHHMSHPVVMVRLKVLAAVEHCLRALRQHKVGLATLYLNQKLVGCCCCYCCCLQLSLYPEVHLVWSPLLPRLSDHAHPVAREAWQVIGCMSEVAGDFLRKRVLEKVWPLLVHTLETMATSSLRTDSLYK